MRADSRPQIAGDRPDNDLNPLVTSGFKSTIVGWLFLVPALTMYGVFVVWPGALSVQYSFYDWNGIGEAIAVGLDNYRSVLTDPTLLASVKNSLYLILFFTAIPVVTALSLVSLVRGSTGPFGTTARAVLFLPQILPLVAAGIAWKWMFSSNGTVNQMLAAVGLESVTRPWLSDFDFALPAVGVIGTWTLVGFCIVLFMSGAGRIDPVLYEAARIDGAGPVREFLAVTLPGLRREIGVAVTITMIAALRVFDLVFIATRGGPGRATIVPGVLIYQLAFTTNQVGLASALGVVLAVIVIVLVFLVQWLFRTRDNG